jgi:hypothetical protein
MVFSYYSGFGKGDRCFTIEGQPFCMPGSAATPADVQREQYLDLARKACGAGDGIAASEILREAQAAKLISLGIVDICAALAGRAQPKPQPVAYEPRELTPAELEMIRREEQQRFLEQLPAISVEDLQGIIAAIDVGQGYKEFGRYDQLAPFREILVAELRRRDLAVRDVAFVEEQPVADVASPSVDQPQMVETVASAVEVAAGAPAKSNTGLYVGLGLAAVAAYFVFGRK